MDRNPVDSYYDIFDWPYSWSKDFNDLPMERLITVKLLYEDLAFWTYHNHWWYAGTGGDVHYGDVVDIYWEEDEYEREQLPRDVGQVVAPLILAQSAEYVRAMLYWGRLWTHHSGWVDYTGVQGDFVDHIHVEFWPEGTEHEPTHGPETADHGFNIPRLGN